MEERVALSFLTQPLERGLAKVTTVVPVLDSVALTDLVMSYETARGFEPAGGYGGAVLTWHLFGARSASFFADLDEPSAKAKRYLLICKCGETECWPLLARVQKLDETVIWDQFEQPHRPDRDYSGFGPFLFDLDDYCDAVNKLALQL